MKKEVIIIGGGVAGCGTALELAHKGFKVTLIESNTTLLSATSGINPGRMGLGFHYIDIDTGKMYMEETIRVAKAYPSMRIGEKKDQDHPLRCGRYFITKNSIFPRDEIIATYEALQQHYQFLCDKDSANQVFGDPTTFFRILDPREYEDDVDTNQVACAIETHEHLLDIPRFTQRLINKITSNSNIKLIMNATMTAAKHSESSKDNQEERFIITYRLNNQNHTLQAPFVVNCTWQNVEAVSGQAGFEDSTNRSNRLKALIRVKLPTSLQEKNSMFFCMGPHCMFSNTGDGYGYATFAPKTNQQTSKATFLPQEIAAKLKQKFIPKDTMMDFLPKEIKEISNITTLIHGYAADPVGQEILDGVASYIPEFAHATLVDIRYGIVKSMGDVDIFDPSSSFHCRNYYGIKPRPRGNCLWIDNSAMKLLYFMKNAQITSELIHTHIETYHLEQKWEAESTNLLAQFMSAIAIVHKGNDPVTQRLSPPKEISPWLFAGPGVAAPKNENISPKANSSVTFFHVNSTSENHRPKTPTLAHG